MAHFLRYNGSKGKNERLNRKQLITRIVALVAETSVLGELVQQLNLIKYDCHYITLLSNFKICSNVVPGS